MVDLFISNLIQVATEIIAIIFAGLFVYFSILQQRRDDYRHEILDLRDKIIEILSNSSVMPILPMINSHFIIYKKVTKLDFKKLNQILVTVSMGVPKKIFHSCLIKLSLEFMLFLPFI